MKNTLTILLLLAVMTGSALSQNLLVCVYEGGSKFLTFDKTASGNVAPVRSNSSNASSGIAVYGKEVFVANGGNCYVYDINNTTNTPKRSFSSAMFSGMEGIAVDANFIYITDFSASRVVVFNKNASGSATPVRTITGANTEISNPTPIAVDDSYIYVCNYTNGKLLVFNKTDDGNVTPVRKISGASTKLAASWQIAVKDNLLYVMLYNEILVFNKTDAGNVAPTRDITGANTLITSARGIAVDDSYIYQFSTVYGGTSSINVFDKSATGNVAPVRTISGASTLIKFGTMIALYDNPTSVSTSVISSVQASTAVSGGTIVTTANIVERGVCYNTTGSPTIADTKTRETGSFGSSTYTASLSSLNPGTTYYIRAYATDSDGETVYGGQLSFSTIPTLGEWGLIAFGSLVAIIGGIVISRRMI